MAWLDSFITFAGEKIFTRKNDADNTHNQGVVIIDPEGNQIGSTNVSNGRGLRVVMMNEAAVKGMAARGAPLAGNPVYLGGAVSTSLASLTPVATGNMVDLIADGVGRRITYPWSVPQDQLATTPISLTGTGDVVVYASQGSIVRIALVGMLIANSSVTDTELIIKSASTEIGRVSVPRAGVAQPQPILSLPLKTATNAGLNFALSASVGGGTPVRVTPLAFTTVL